MHNDIKTTHKGKIYLVKDDISEGNCFCCALEDEPCDGVTYVDGRQFNCGTDRQILVEDTPEAIMEYLETKLNGYEEYDE
jgi:hypothetical protein